MDELVIVEYPKKYSTAFDVDTRTTPSADEPFQAGAAATTLLTFGTLITANIVPVDTLIATTDEFGVT